MRGVIPSANMLVQTSVLWQSFRRQCCSYPYWTDFAYRSSLLWRPRSLAWLGFHLLIVLNIVLVLLAHTWDSYPSVSQVTLSGSLTQYTLQGRWRCQHRLLLTLWLLLSTWFFGGADRVRTYTAVLSSGLQPGALPLRRLLHNNLGGAKPSAHLRILASRS